MPNHLEEWLPHEVRAQEQHLAERGVHQRDLAVLVEEEDAFLHAVEDAAHEIALRAQLADRLREAASELVERGAELPDVLLARDACAHREIALVHAPRGVGEGAHGLVEPAHRELAHDEAHERASHQ